MSLFEDWLLVIAADDPGLHYAALTGAMLFAREREGGDETSTDVRYCERLDVLWKRMSEDEIRFAERMFQEHWSTSPPTVAVVATRHQSEGQPPRFWVKHIKPDGHGNEAGVVELRVLDGELHALMVGDDRFERWEKFNPAQSSDQLWAGCFPPVHRPPPQPKRERHVSVYIQPTTEPDRFTLSLVATPGPITVLNVVSGTREEVNAAAHSLATILRGDIVDATSVPHFRYERLRHQASPTDGK